MGLFDDVVINAKSAAAVVTKRAEKLVDLSKLKYAAAGINNEISKKKEALGDYVFESSKEGFKLDPEVIKDRIAELTELEENLLSTKELITSVKNRKSCKECGAENDKEAAYCNKCGANIETKEEEFVTEDEDDDVTVVAAEYVKEAKENVAKAAEVAGDFAKEAAEKTKDVAEDIAEGVKDTAEAIKEEF
ncbi:hypothetical protein AGMMS50284_6850 [Clostridia bacterium]|nr:hypothetical protein AGMMS50284_6850 [Clostridia bacterium]